MDLINILRSFLPSDFFYFGEDLLFHAFDEDSPRSSPVRVESPSPPSSSASGSNLTAVDENASHFHRPTVTNFENPATIDTMMNRAAVDCRIERSQPLPESPRHHHQSSSTTDAANSQIRYTKNNVDSEQQPPMCLQDELMFAEKAREQHGDEISGLIRTHNKPMNGSLNEKNENLICDTSEMDKRLDLNGDGNNIVSGDGQLDMPCDIKCPSSQQNDNSSLPLIQNTNETNHNDSNVAIKANGPNKNIDLIQTVCKSSQVLNSDEDLCGLKHSSSQDIPVDLEKPIVNDQTPTMNGCSEHDTNASANSFLDSEFDYFVRLDDVCSSASSGSSDQVVKSSQHVPNKSKMSTTSKTDTIRQRHVVQTGNKFENEDGFFENTCDTTRSKNVELSADEKPEKPRLERKKLSVPDFSSLLYWRDMPRHLQFNPYIYSGYRPLLSIWGSLCSLFYLHNETVNILTHGIPIVYILVTVPSIMPWETDTWFLSWCHLIGAVAPWIGSFVYHLFMNLACGESVYYRLLQLDMLGIWISQSFGALPMITATVYCLPKILRVSITMFYCILSLWGLYKAMTAWSPWERRLSFMLPFVMRVLLGGLRATRLAGGHPDAFTHIVLQDLVSIIGGAIGALHIPEKWIPGKVDMFLNSHNIMHVLVVMAVYSMHQATVLDLQWMSMVQCGLDQGIPSQIIPPPVMPLEEQMLL